jgi:regulatory protein YycH of two-component signal transduction system YycFG
MKISEKMNNKSVIVVVYVVVIVVIGFLLWNYYGNVDYFSKTKHQNASWTVIQDSKEDTIAVETTNLLSGIV